MKNIKVLGSGCRNCEITYGLIREVAETLAVDVELEKVQDIARIMGFGVMSTPAVVVDGEVVHSGSVPSRQQIGAWLAE